MLSASTARLLRALRLSANLSWFRSRVPTSRCPPVGCWASGTASRVGRAESNLVGRRWEMSAVEGLVDRANDGHGAVVGVVGPPAIAKGRLVR